jgi:hypothetical protein
MFSSSAFYSYREFLCKRSPILTLMLSLPQPVNDVVEGTMFITLTDTSQIDLIEVKVGSKEGQADLANHQFTYDQTSGLPAGMAWQRTGYRITLSLGSFAYSDLQFGYVRLKNSSGVWSDTFAFVTN